MKSRILVIEDDAGFATALERVLRADGHDVVVHSSLSDGLAAGPETFDALLVDIGLPDGLATNLFAEWKQKWPELPVIFMTGSPTVDSAVEALRGGAFDYLKKPLSLDLLRTVLLRAIESSRLRKEVSRLRGMLALRDEATGLVGRSHALRKLRDQIAVLAPAPTTILIQGETGTGKEIVARALHRASGRPGKFVAINCAALPEHLTEAELFGHRKGAFTGALSERAGMVAEAEGGTLFLDEVGEMGPALQAKLLRLLQNREYRPLGSDGDKTADIRVVAATNRDLRAKSSSSTGSSGFRDDVYWRLAVVVLTMPPLRDRRDDIGDLAMNFIAIHSARLGRHIEGIDPCALKRLEDHDWPGNVRELENVIERAILLGHGNRIDEDDLALGSAAWDAPSGLTEEIGAFERNQLIRLLEEHGGSVAKAATAAGRNRTAFYAALKKYGINSSKPSKPAQK